MSTADSPYNDLRARVTELVERGEIQAVIESTPPEIRRLVSLQLGGAVSDLKYLDSEVLAEAILELADPNPLQNQRS